MKRTLFAFLTTIFCLLTSNLVWAQTIFSNGWESASGIVAKDVDDNTDHWAYLEAVALQGNPTARTSDRFTILNDGGAREGSYYARVEARKGDNPFVPGNDIYQQPLVCCDNTNRAEVVGMTGADNAPIYENASSGIQKLSFSIKFDQSWDKYTPKDGDWNVFLQLHGPNGYNPALAFSVLYNKIHFNMRTGDVTKNTSVTEFEMEDGGDLNTGKWIDFILTAKFTTDNTGFVNIMRRNEGETGYSEVFSLNDTATLQYDPAVNNGAAGNHFWKQGIYRNDQDHTNILYLDALKLESVSSVPEPYTYLLLLAGLTLLWLDSRRRKS